MLVLAMAMGVAGCSDGARRGEGATRGFMADGAVGEVELLAARDSVGNPDRPVYGDSAVSAPRIWEATAAEWEDPVRIALSPERVFVLDRGARAIRTVMRDGRPGARADRSVALHGPTGIAWSGGLLAVSDTSYQQVMILEPFGREVRSLLSGSRATVVAAGHRRFAMAGEGEGALSWELAGEDPLGHDQVIVLDPVPAGPERPECGLVSGGRWLIQASCSVPAFHVTRLDGRRTRAVTIDRPPPPVDRARADLLGRRMAERNAAGDSAAVLAIVDSLDALDASVQPVRGVRYDERARRFALWSVSPDGKGALVDLLSSEGVYLARLRFGAEWLDFAMDGGMLFALERRAYGPARLAAYAIRLPGGGPGAGPRAADPAVPVPDGAAP
jgi:hypothetical protein